MPYPKEFYYTDRQNSILYRRQPTTSLKYDTNRMIRGLSCWIDDSSTSKEKKKKLILADWNCFLWSKNKIEQIIKGSKTYIQFLINELVTNEWIFFK